MLKFLFFGDIMGKTGRQAFISIIPELKKQYNPDFIIANGENASHGDGINETALKELLAAGINFLTGGNHSFHLKDGVSIFQNDKNPIIRPMNFFSQAPVKGFKIINIGIWQIAIVNLIGQVFMPHQYNSPFEAINSFFENYTLIKNKEDGKEPLNGIIIDFHAEATAEKKALGWYLDGKVSAILGTHTHIPTADLQKLPNGTLYISDVGMCGAKDSIIGLDPIGIIPSYLNQLPPQMEIGSGKAEINAIYFELNPENGIIEKYEQIIKYLPENF